MEQIGIDKINVGKRIKEIRSKLNQTQVEFASNFNTNNGIISKWEKGLILPSEERYEQIARLGGVTVNWLLYGVDTFIPPIPIYSPFQVMYKQFDNPLFTVPYESVSAFTPLYNRHEYFGVLGEIVLKHYIDFINHEKYEIFKNTSPEIRYDDRNLVDELSQSALVMIGLSDAVQNFSEKSNDFEYNTIHFYNKVTEDWHVSSYEKYYYISKDIYFEPLATLNIVTKPITFVFDQNSFFLSKEVRVIKHMQRDYKKEMTIEEINNEALLVHRLPFMIARGGRFSDEILIKYLDTLKYLPDYEKIFKYEIDARVWKNLGFVDKK